MPNSSQAGKATAASWKQAKTLANLVDGANQRQARSFLSTNKGQYDDVLKLKKTDKRNPKIRKLVTEFQNYLQAGRMSEGDPTRSPRAGAPKVTELKPTRAKGRKKVGDVNKDDFDTLLDLKKLAAKVGNGDHRKGLPRLTELCQLYMELLDLPN
jgi:hypothetical protein